MQKLVIATSNPHKVEEIAAVLGQIGIACVPLARTDIPEPDENGATFEENARIKAIAADIEVSAPSSAVHSKAATAPVGVTVPKS